MFLPPWVQPYPEQKFQIALVLPDGQNCAMRQWPWDFTLKLIVSLRLRLMRSPLKGLLAAQSSRLSSLVFVRFSVA